MGKSLCYLQYINIYFQRCLHFFYWSSLLQLLFFHPLSSKLKGCKGKSKKGRAGLTTRLRLKNIKKLIKKKEEKFFTLLRRYASRRENIRSERKWNAPNFKYFLVLTFSGFSKPNKFAVILTTFIFFILQKCRFSAKRNYENGWGQKRKTIYFVRVTKQAAKT